MPKLTPSSRALLLLALSAAVLAGCAGARDWLTGKRTASASEPVILGAPEADHYLHELYKLSNGDPATQAEIYADAESAARLTPDPSTRLRYALVLATPGHPGSNPEEAQDIFRELLAQTELMTPSETALATVHLKYVEQEIVLGAEARRLRNANARAQTSEELAIAQRIAKVESENRELKRSLEEAEQKLEAITTIERSIREQTETEDNP